MCSLYLQEYKTFKKERKLRPLGVLFLQIHSFWTVKVEAFWK